MNNKFEFGRFGQMLSLDLKKCIGKFGTSFIVMWCIPFALWIPSLLFGFSMPILLRFYAFYITLYVAIIIAPAKVFGDINLNREGIRFAMLPASMLEKFLSYTLCCLLMPVLVFAGEYVVDCLLTLLPFGGFDEFVTFFGLFGFLSGFTDDPNSGVFQAGMDVSSMLDTFGELDIATRLVNFFFMVAFFMFGNLLFRSKNKAGMSLLVLIGFKLILAFFSKFLLLSSNFRQLMENSGNLELGSHIVSQTMLISLIVHAILALGLYIASYFRMKSLKY